MKRRRFALDVRPGAVALLAGLYFLLPLRWCARLALAVPNCYVLCTFAILKT